MRLNAMSETLNQRAQQILKILVERYIQDGLPIGSKTLVEAHALGLSSATVRNILAELEESGYLISPHTSSGRIPTELGYRFFVDTLLTLKPLNGVEVNELQSKLYADLNLSNLLQSASIILSSLTKMTGVVTLPRRNRVELRQIEFLKLTTNQVLVILVLNNREVQNRIIYTDRVYTQGELQEVANYLNTHCSGQDLMTARSELLKAIQNDRDTIDNLIQRAIEVMHKAFPMTEQQHNDYIMAGQENVLNYAKDKDFMQLRNIFDAFTQKQEILNLLDHALNAEGIQIFIGKESGHEAFDQCSIVAASYSAEGQMIGTLGVIGPTRMPYDRVISAVDVTAKLLSAALNQV
jgi:heat-inducible transcriptional repressor